MEILGSYLIAIALILIIMTAWISVQRMARRFAARHPEFGPARECLGCGLGCVCDNNNEHEIKAQQPEIDREK